MKREKPKAPPDVWKYLKLVKRLHGNQEQKNETDERQQDPNATGNAEERGPDHGMPNRSHTDRGKD